MTSKLGVPLLFLAIVLTIYVILPLISNAQKFH